MATKVKANAETKPAILEELTAKQEALLEVVAEEYIADLTVHRAVDMAITKRWLKIVYGLFDMQVPERIEIVGSPEAACKLASELTGEKVDWTDDCGVGDGGWVSYYDYFERIGVLSKTDNAEVMAFAAFRRIAWDTILLDECAIVISRPTAMRLDDAGNLHASGAPCIEWGDGEKDYAWHGEWMPERVIMGAREFSRDEYLSLKNTEQRRAIGEIAGWARIADLLGARIVDSWSDGVTGLSYVLLRCEDGSQILRKLSPSLKDGSQPTYFEPVHEELRTARAARKWQATRLTPAQCEHDPDLTYGSES